MIVMKFGGTSNEDAAAMRNVIRIVNAHLKSQPVVVISAIARATNELEQITRTAALGDKQQANELVESLIRRHLVIVKDLIAEPSRRSFLENLIAGYHADLLSKVSDVTSRQLTGPRAVDTICSFGERLSSRIIASALEESGITSKWIDVKDFLLTDENFGRARPVVDLVEQNLRTIIEPLVRAGTVPVTQGFIGVTTKGEYTTMGRESSDFSATIIGALLPAKKVQIWTDVDGILTADPRLVPSVRKVRRMSFAEALHLSVSGAKVLHPTTMVPVLEKEIPVQILNSKREQGSGTLVEVALFPAKGFVKSIAHKRNMVLLRFSGLPEAYWSGILPALSSRGITPFLTSLSGNQGLILIDKGGLNSGLLDELNVHGSINVLPDKSSITVIGEGVEGIADRISSVLAEGNLWMMSGPVTSMSLSYVIDTKQLESMVLKLHKVFIEDVPDREVFDLVGS